jgi:hypothetical protein
VPEPITPTTAAVPASVKKPPTLCNTLSPQLRNSNTLDFSLCISYLVPHCGHLSALSARAVFPCADRIHSRRHDSCAISVHLHGCVHARVVPIKHEEDRLGVCVNMGVPASFGSSSRQM